MRTHLFTEIFKAHARTHAMLPILLFGLFVAFAVFVGTLYTGRWVWKLGVVQILFRVISNLAYFMIALGIAVFLTERTKVVLFQEILNQPFMLTVLSFSLIGNFYYLTTAWIRNRDHRRLERSLTWLTDERAKLESQLSHASTRTRAKERYRKFLAEDEAVQDVPRFSFWHYWRSVPYAYWWSPLKDITAKQAPKIRQPQKKQQQREETEEDEDVDEEEEKEEEEEEEERRQQQKIPRLSRLERLKVGRGAGAKSTSAVENGNLEELLKAVTLLNTSLHRTVPISSDEQTVLPERKEVATAVLSGKSESSEFSETK